MRGTKKLCILVMLLGILFGGYGVARGQEEEESEVPKTLEQELEEAGHIRGADSVEITYDNMKSVLSGDWVLLLYTPWTRGSVELLTYLPYLAGATSKQAPGLRYAAVDCSLYPEVHTYFPHKGYPTLYLVRSGHIAKVFDSKIEEAPLFAFAEAAAADSGEASAVPEISGNKAVDEKLAAAKVFVSNCAFEYAKAIRDGTDKLYVMAVERGYNPLVFAGMFGGAAVMTLLVVFLVIALCQSDIDMLEAQKEMVKKNKKTDGDDSVKEKKAAPVAKEAIPKSPAQKKKNDKKRKID